MTNAPTDPITDSPAPANHDLTPMETFFDTLFNQHMVLPQPQDGADDHGGAADEQGTDAA